MTVTDCSAYPRLFRSCIRIGSHPVTWSCHVVSFSQILRVAWFMIVLLEVLAEDAGGLAWDRVVVHVVVSEHLLWSCWSRLTIQIWRIFCWCLPKSPIAVPPVSPLSMPWVRTSPCSFASGSLDCWLRAAGPTSKHECERIVVSHQQVRANLVAIRYRATKDLLWKIENKYRILYWSSSVDWWIRHLGFEVSGFNVETLPVSPVEFRK